MKLQNIAKLFIAGMFAVTTLAACDDDDVVKTPLDSPVAVVTEQGYSTLSFSWDKVTNATQYAYELRDQSGELIDGDVTSGTTATFTGLDDDTPYTLEVWAFAALNSDKNETSKIASLTARTAAKTPIAAPQNLTAMVSGSQVSIKWDAVDDATSYEYSYVHNYVETTGTVTTNSLYLTELTAGTYSVSIYAVPSAEDLKKSPAAVISFVYTEAETDELWRRTGKYTSLDYNDTYDVDIVAMKDGSYKLETWAGYPGYDICFTVDGSGNITITNPTEEYASWASSGYYYVSSGDGYSTCFYCNTYSTFSGTSSSGSIQLYRFYPSGYDTFVW
jgi:predicted phage tail protein